VDSDLSEGVVALSHKEAVLLVPTSLLENQYRSVGRTIKTIAVLSRPSWPGVEGCGQTESRYRSAMPSTFDAFVMRCYH
jgi:hypothetical protein